MIQSGFSSTIKCVIFVSLILDGIKSPCTLVTDVFSKHATSLIAQILDVPSSASNWWLTKAIYTGKAMVSSSYILSPPDHHSTASMPTIHNYSDTTPSNHIDRACQRRNQYFSWSGTRATRLISERFLGKKGSRRRRNLDASSPRHQRRQL